MAKDLKYFMNDVDDEIIKISAPERFVDDKGERLEFEVKQLTQADIQKIYKMYRRRTMATDRKGNPIVNNGEVVWKSERDNDRAARHIIVEALVYPDLKDKELMAHYKCNDVTEMPLLVFPHPDEYDAVTRSIFKAIGIINDLADEEVDDAKN